MGQQQLRQNLRLPYWSISAAGDFEQLDSLIEYLKMLPFMAECTKPFYNHSGGRGGGSSFGHTGSKETRSHPRTRAAMSGRLR